MAIKEAAEMRNDNILGQRGLVFFRCWQTFSHLKNIRSVEQQLKYVPHSPLSPALCFHCSEGTASR